jgi:hypothetical protein
MNWKSLARVLCVAWLPSLVYATDLRGRVMRSDPYQGRLPASAVQLTLLNSSNQAVHKPVVSGNDGFYYFYNVAPGTYRLAYTYRKQQGSVQVVVGRGKNQDIALISIGN